MLCWWYIWGTYGRGRCEDNGGDEEEGEEEGWEERVSVSHSCWNVLVVDMNVRMSIWSVCPSTIYTLWDLRFHGEEAITVSKIGKYFLHGITSFLTRTMPLQWYYYFMKKNEIINSIILKIPSSTTTIFSVKLFYFQITP